jgi:hypothetical protein
MESSRRAWEGSYLSKRGRALTAALAAGVGLASLLSARTARAAFELEWSAPAECPNADFVQAEVEKVVGRPWQELGQRWQSAQARVTPEGGGYRLRVTVVTHAGGASERDVLAASCTEATEAAVAIFATGMAAEETASAAGATSKGAEAEEEPQPAAPRPRVAGNPPSDELGASAAAGDGVPILALLGARLGADFGTLSAVAPFAEVRGGFELGRFELLGAFGLTGKVLDEVRSSGAGAQMFLLMGSLSGCWHVTSGNPVLKGCGGVELGSLEASGVGTVERRDGQAFWSAGVAEGALDWHITGTSYAAFGVSAVLPFRQLHVAMPPADIHRTSPVAVRPWLGIGLRFR